MSKKYRCVYSDSTCDSFKVGGVYTLTDDNRVMDDDGILWGPIEKDTIKWLENTYRYRFEETKDMFTLNDIKTGDKITMRNGYEAVAMFGGSRDYFMGSRDTMLGEFESKCNYGQDMTNRNGSAYDIIRVERPVGVLRLSKHTPGFAVSMYTVVYARDERKKMTVDEIEAALGYKVAIVDEDGKEEK